MRKGIFISLLFFVTLVNLPSVFASDGINFLELPEKVGEAFFNGNTFAGGLVCSFILLMFFLFPTLYLIRNQKGTTTLVAICLVGLSALSVCVAITWLPLWTFIIMVLGIAAVLSITFGNNLGDIG